MAHFGDSLRNLRKERGLTQAELADAADVERSSIAKFEQNGVAPNVYVAYKLSQVLGVSLDSMLAVNKNE